MQAKDASLKVQSLMNELEEHQELFDSNDTYDFPIESQLNKIEEEINNLGEALEEALG